MLVSNSKRFVRANARFCTPKTTTTYPFLSAKSIVRKRAGETLFEVWALKIVLLPRLCTKKRLRVSD